MEARFDLQVLQCWVSYIAQYSQLCFVNEAHCPPLHHLSNEGRAEVQSMHLGWLSSHATRRRCNVTDDTCRCVHAVIYSPRYSERSIFFMCLVHEICVANADALTFIYRSSVTLFLCFLKLVLLEK